MSTQLAPSDSTSSGTRTPGRLLTARRVAFSLVLLVLAGLNLVMAPRALLVSPVMGWVQSMGPHQLHDMTIFATLWLAVLVPVALLLYRPRKHVNAILAPLVAFVPLTAFGLVIDSPIAMSFVLGTVLTLVALALHPAARSALRFDRVERVDRRLLGLFALGGVPVLVYAGLEASKQLARTGDHALFVHYGGMAAASLVVVAMGALAVVRVRDWRFAAWLAGALAAFVGVASAVFPTMESSLGLAGGALLVLWAVAFVASVEFVRRGDQPVPAPTESRTTAD